MIDTTQADIVPVQRFGLYNRTATKNEIAHSAVASVQKEVYKIQIGNGIVAMM
jgi:hypothetical protein